MKHPPKMSALLAAVILIASVLSLVGSSEASAAPRTAVVASAARLHCQSHKSESTPHKGKVVVPTSYCYDPHTTDNTVLHDYCSHSPDSIHFPGWFVGGTADFRGPCARHDLCLQAGHSHGTCDGPLLGQMKQNCRYTFGSSNPYRYSCYGTAYTYYVAIKAYTWYQWIHHRI